MLVYHTTCSMSIAFMKIVKKNKAESCPSALNFAGIILTVLSKY